MQADGYGAAIAFDGYTVTVTGKGLGKGALGASSREIPASALQSIDFKPANPLVNGYIELVTAQGKTLVHFRRKQGAVMSAIFQTIVRAAPAAAQGKVRAPLASTLRDAQLEHQAARDAAPAPAGWYRDTGGSGRMRYWDGTAWTAHFADNAPSDQVTDPVSSASPAPENSGPASAPSQESSGTAGKPHGRPVPPWSERLISQNIVGESFHEATFKTLAAEYGHRSVPEYGIEITEARAAIVRDPENPYDPNAVAIWIDGRHLVGHLPRNVAAQYAERLESLDRATYLLVPARVWIGQRSDWDDRTGAAVTGLRGSVTVYLPDTAGIVPFNDLPDEPHTVLPWGRAIQITGEEHHMDVLRTFVLGTDPRHVAATVHVIEEPRRTGDPARVIEVRLDGQRVGVMSKTVSEQIQDLVTYVASNGRTPVVRAIIKGSDLRADVTVHMARTSEVPQKWLDTVGDR